ncbi:CWC16 protein [Trichoderma novae-zelandiae]
MQGFNMGRYVPPDAEGTTSANRLHKKHALGSRASKLASHGILTVRFEMPYPVWCLHCPRPTIIGQGVRFNAEKKRAGSYLSTPVWSFRFKHAECGGWIEMRTDPKRTAYVVVEGARKRDAGGDGGRHEEGVEGGGEGVILTDGERDELRNNAFASLEKTIADRKRLAMAADRIDDLASLSGKQWSDPYALNQRLRRDFRRGRRQREQDAARAEDLRDRMGLDLELAAEAEEDAQRAALVDFGGGDGVEGVDRALRKPLFSTTTTTTTTAAARKKKTQRQPWSGAEMKDAATLSKAEKEASRRKEAFVADILSSTRAARDPFLAQHHTNHGSGDKAAANRPSLGIIVKRKKRIGGDGDKVSAAAADDDDATKASVPSVQGLVEYDSD